jgi:hypothetical protein
MLDLINTLRGPIGGMDGTNLKNINMCSRLFFVVLDLVSILAKGYFYGLVLV